MSTFKWSAVSVEKMGRLRALHCAEDQCLAERRLWRRRRSAKGGGGGRKEERRELEMRDVSGEGQGVDITSAMTSEALASIGVREFSRVRAPF